MRHPRWLAILRATKEGDVAIFREPVIAFSIVFLFSIGAAFMLFRVLGSQAAIRGKRWQAGGAIAGFLLVFFPSWYSVKPMLPMESGPYISPLNVPNGFRPFSEPWAPFAVAIPRKWLQIGPTLNLSFASPDEKEEGLFFISVHEDFPSDAFNERDIQGLLAEVSEMLHQIFNPKSVEVEKGEFTSYQGLRSYRAPATFHYPGQTPTKVSIQLIWDHRRHRLYYIICDDSSTGRQVASTLNIP
jgi:hypothetical protein